MKLQVTNKYYPNFDQFSRILQFIDHQERQKVSLQEIADTLGIPFRQLRSYISTMRSFGIILPRCVGLTPFGNFIIRSDPYFEKYETLWIVHYQVSSNPEYVVWNRIINTVLPAQDQFSVKPVSDQFFSDLAIHFSQMTYCEKLPGEIKAVFHAYTDSSLSLLRVLTMVGDDIFIKADPADVPNLAFLFCLAQYRERHYPGSSALEIDDVCCWDNSPGRVLQMSEYLVRSQLDELHNRGLVRLEQMANLDQVRLGDDLTSDLVLRLIYEGKDAN